MPGRVVPVPNVERLFDPGLRDETRQSDEFYTPWRILDALGVEFDMDVASPPGGLPWIPARRFVDESENGLGVPWAGIVWCNPPYSNPLPWARKMADHDNGVMLLPVDTSTGWWHDHVVKAEALCFIRGRVRFVAADGKSRTSWTGRFPSVLVGFGAQAGFAVRDCGLGWAVAL